MRPIPFALLTPDARVVAGAHFGCLEPNVGAVVFNTPSRISVRGKAALIELELAGIVASSLGEALGSVSFTPIVDCSAEFEWVGRNQHLLEGWYIVDAPNPRDTLRFSDGSERPIGIAAPTAGTA